MCGRFVCAADRSRIESQFDAIADEHPPLNPDFNVAPTKKVYAVVERHRANSDEAPSNERQVKVMTWGLIPFWSKDSKIASRLVNARLETAASKPSFRTAWAKRRAIIPADGYYEWLSRMPNPGAKPYKQPFYIHPSDGSELAMAGLYEIWRNPEVADDRDPDAFRWTCTILTTTATDELGQIHDRMPLLVPATRTGDWLDPHSVAPAEDILVPAAPGLLAVAPVSTQVNSVRNNGPELIDPIRLDSEPVGE